MTNKETRVAVVTGAGRG
ncbi:hypothetical protein, partial [Frankia sp. AvcI1]